MMERATLPLGQAMLLVTSIAISRHKENKEKMEKKRSRINTETMTQFSVELANSKCLKGGEVTIATIFDNFHSCLDVGYYTRSRFFYKRGRKTAKLF